MIAPIADWMISAKARAEPNAELGKQERRYQRAGDANDYVADDAEPGAAHDLAGKPARDQADEQNDENAFVGKLH
jgi:hypothetical protein